MTTRQDLINPLIAQLKEPSSIEYLHTACQIAQIDNGVTEEEISTSIGNYTEGVSVINKDWYDNNVSSSNKPTWTKVNTVISELKTAYTNNAWSRQRFMEYPSVEELIVALYDTDDKAALATKRAATKTKWPKDNSGPVE